MDCHPVAELTEVKTGSMILIGNPNVGKSVIFGALTKRYVTVSNYTGTTVEIAEGMLSDGRSVIDTPGTNSLTSISDDEQVTASILFNQLDNLQSIIQVADAKNLSRALLLTFQLAELEIPLVLNLNMFDEARANGVTIDTELLAERLGVEVTTTIATRGIGMDNLSQATSQAKQTVPLFSYDEAIEAGIDDVSRLLPVDVKHRRGLSVRLLCGDDELEKHYGLTELLTPIRDMLASRYARPLRTVIVGQQMDAAQKLWREVMSVGAPPHTSFNRRLSRWMIHPVIGWPILLVVLWLVYKFVGELGAGTLVGFLEETVFSQWINPISTRIIDAILPIPLIHDLLVGDYGVITMALSYGLALVLPIVTTFFLAFSVLEDSGYLPRLAIMFNRAFKLMGLNGKAVLPMVLGLGCDTMATLSTRILETRKERIIVTLLLALGVPCSAQLGVILGMFDQVGSGAILIWLVVIASTMVTVGYLAAKLLPGESSDFILELPPLRVPRLDNIAIKTLARLEWYLKEVLPLFIVGTLLLFVLDKTGALVVIEQVASPLVVGWLGLPAAATGAFLIGFLRRDYGAAGLFAMMLAGQLDTRQALVSLIVITLFIPCIANVLIIVKEYGGRVATGVALTVFPLAFLIGGLVNFLLQLFQVAL